MASIDEKLELCGCGLPDEMRAYLFDVLTFIKERSFTGDMSKEVEWNKYCESIKAKQKHLFVNDGQMYFIFNFLQSLGLIEHGSSLPGWLTDKGVEIWAQLKHEVR